MPDDYCDPAVCEALSDVCFVFGFDGTITTLIQENTQAPIGEDDIESQWGSFYYIPAEKASNLFSAAYVSPDELLNEFKEKFSAESISFPADYDWWRRLVRITGTVCN